MVKKLKGHRTLLYLWKLQKGRCPICTERITSETGWHLHHLIRRVDGGSDAVTNLCLLHLYATGKATALVLSWYYRLSRKTRLRVIQAV